MTTQVGMIEVDSTNIQSIGYDVLRRILYVRFLTGRMYRYFGVGPLTFGRFQRAHSKGRFFYQFVRYRYKYELVENGRRVA